MTNKTPPPSAKEKVLEWVRKYNPNTVVQISIPCPDGLEGCCVCHFKKEYKPLGLQELLIALNKKLDFGSRLNAKGDIRIYMGNKKKDNFRVHFNLKENLHEQSEDFYTSILPLIDEN